MTVQDGDAVFDNVTDWLNEEVRLVVAVADALNEPDTEPEPEGDPVVE